MSQSQKPDTKNILLLVLSLDAYLLAPSIPLLLYYVADLEIELCIMVGVMLFIGAQAGMFFIRRHPEKFGGVAIVSKPQETQSEEL